MRNRFGHLVLGGLAVLVCSSVRAGQYVQTNIVSDLATIAPGQPAHPDLESRGACRLKPTGKMRRPA